MVFLKNLGLHEMGDWMQCSKLTRLVGQELSGAGAVAGDIAPVACTNKQVPNRVLSMPAPRRQHFYEHPSLLGMALLH